MMTIVISMVLKMHTEMILALIRNRTVSVFLKYSYTPIRIAKMK